MRYLWVIVLAVVVVGVLSGCFDQPTGEISIIATRNGERTGCGVMMFNSKGVQVDQVTTDMQGLVYIKNVKAGSYTLKFVDHQGNLYPAVINVSVDPGEQETVRVDLNKSYDAEPEGSAEQ